jgi:ABC-type phosphate/phosphonate transport system substrate-binding protein
VAPGLVERKDDIKALMLGMAADAQGSEVLAELHISQWVEITDAELAQMEQLLTMSI